METPNYRRLIVWQKSHQNSIELIALLFELPWKVNRLVQQTLSAATSVGANIAEGSGALGKDRIRYWQIALNSSYELDNWVQVFKDSKIALSISELALIEQRNWEVIRMLSKLIRS